MAEFSALVAIFNDPDTNQPSALQAFLPGDTIASSVLDNDTRNATRYVVDTSTSIDATRVYVVDTSADIADTRQTVFDSSAGWAAGLDAGTYNDIVSVSSTVLAGSGTWEDVYNSVYDGSSTWETGGTDLGPLEASVGNLDVWSGTVDTSVGTLDGRVTSNDDDITTIINWSGTVDASVATLTTSTLDVCSYITGKESIWESGGTDLGPLEASVGNLDVWSGTVDTSVGTLDGRVDAAEVDIDNIIIWSGTVDSSAATLDGRITSNDDDITTIITWSGTVDTSAATLDGRITSNDDDITTIINWSGTVDSSVGTLDGRVDTAEVDIDNILIWSGTVDSSVATVDGRITSNDDDITTIINWSGTVDSSVGTLDGRVDTAEVDIDNLELSANRLFTWSGTVDSSVGTLDGRVDVIEPLVPSATGFNNWNTIYGDRDNIISVSGSVAASDTAFLNGATPTLSNDLDANNNRLTNVLRLSGVEGGILDVSGSTMIFTSPEGGIRLGSVRTNTATWTKAGVEKSVSAYDYGLSSWLTVKDNSGTWGTGGGGGVSPATTPVRKGQILFVSGPSLQYNLTHIVDDPVDQRPLIWSTSQGQWISSRLPVNQITSSKIGGVMVGNGAIFYEDDTLANTSATWDTAYADRINNISVSTTVLNNSGTWGVDTDTTDHTLLSNIGTNTHPQIDEHIAGVVAASGNWQSAYSSDLFPSATGFANWNTIYGDRDNIISVSSTVLNNSGTWGGGASAQGFENWNNTYAWTAGASADVVSVSSTVLNNSGTWATDTDTTDHTLLSNIGTNTHAQIDEHIAGVVAASGNWQSAYTTDLFPSAAGFANWNTAYGDRDNNISVSTTVLNNSATWGVDTDTTDHTLLSNIGTNTHAQIDTHIADSTIHFTEGSIDHTNIINIGTNTHAQIDEHITGVVAASGNWQTAYTTDLFPSAAGYANWNTAYGDRDNNISVSTTVLNNSATWAIDTDTTDHTALTNIGTNTHAQIDTHIADSTIHFTEGSIDHTNITNIGTNTHAQIDSHIGGVVAASGNWESAYTTDLFPSAAGFANWNTIYGDRNNIISVSSTVLNNSGTWGGGGGGASAEGFENWNSTYTSVLNTSANWDEAYLSATNTTDVSSIFSGDINVTGSNPAHTGLIGTTDAATFGIQSTSNTSIIAPSIILSATSAYQFRKNGSTTYTDTDFPQSCRDWDSTYGTVLANSGTWGGGGGGGVAAGITVVNTGTDNIDSAGALVPLDTTAGYPAYGSYATDYSYTAGNSYVTINTAGTYEVTFNVAYTSTIQRWNGILKIYKGTGGASPSSWIGYGASKMGYVRSASGHNEASLILTCLVTCSANDTIGGWVQREAAAGTCSLVANETFMTIKRMA